METDLTTSYPSESPPRDERKKKMMKVSENMTERPQEEEFDWTTSYIPVSSPRDERKKKKKYSVNITERPMQDLLKDVLKDVLWRNPLDKEGNPLDKEGLLEVLYSKRSRPQLNQMLNNVYEMQDREWKLIEKQDERPMQEDDVLWRNPLDKEGNPLDKEGLLEVLYSKRSRPQLNQMLNNVEEMIEECAYDGVYSDNEIIWELEKAVLRLAAGRIRLELRVPGWYPDICYPLPRESISNEPCLLAPLDTLWRELDQAVLTGRGIVDVASSYDVIDFWPEQIVLESDALETDVDVATNDVSLLSLGGTLVDTTGEKIVLEPNTFKGDFVMVFCINAPALFGIDETCQHLLNLCKELSSERPDVKMVMVANMNVLADSKWNFSVLFRGFPTTCLAIPYEDWEQRERVCKLLKCSPYLIRCGVYNPDGYFLTSFCVDACENPYGAEAFPFTRERLKETDAERERLRNDSLDKLLRPYEYSPDVVVYKLDNPQEQICVSEAIKEKHVGLYVCCEGGFVPSLRKLYLHCKENGKEFEIVVLYLPLFSRIDPDLFKDKMESRLLEENLSVWCLPFNNSVSLRLWGLTMDYDCGYNGDDKWEDKLIIVGTDGKILDLYGSAVIEMYGGFDAYPFTRGAVVEKKMKEVREVRLESLLEGEQLFRGGDRNDTIYVESLLSREKKIFVFAGHPDMHVGRNCFDHEGFVSAYKEMKARGVEFEVVFVVYPSEYEFVEEEEEYAQYEFAEGGEGEEWVEWWRAGEGEEIEAGEGEEIEAETGIGIEDEREAEVEGDMAPYIHPVEEFTDMPWYIHRLEASFTPLAEKLKELFGHESLVGFGKDGRICSVKRLYYGTVVPCLDDTLEDDIYQLLNINRHGKI